jgi:hypothetical protein
MINVLALRPVRSSLALLVTAPKPSTTVVVWADTQDTHCLSESACKGF